MMLLKLTNSDKHALVDDKHYARVSLYSWHRVNNNGIIRMSTFPREKLANFIMNDYVNRYDHKDRNRLNNLEENLRVCTQQQNNCNKIKQNNFNNFKGTSSKYKGVTYDKASKKWRSKITVNRKTIHLGFYSTELEAAQAYDLAALKYHGEFACLNFPTNDQAQT